MIPHIEPLIDNLTVEALKIYMESDGWLTEHQWTRKLEKEICDFLKVQHCLMYPNCTLALYAALVALGIGAGDEVVVPDFTMIATANAVKMTGATPIFIDVDAYSLCIDLDAVKNALTRKTRAIMAVSLNGRSPDYGRLLQLKGIHIIEDAAQSFGSYSNGQAIGTFGTVGCFSFSPHKIITMGQGGCIVTNDDGVAERLKKFRNFGRKSSGGYDHDEFGINLKFTDLQAVVGLAQLETIDWRIAQKRAIFERYRDNLDDYVYMLPTDLSECTPWYVDVFDWDRDSLADYLTENGIGTQKFYPSLQTTGPYKSSKSFIMSEWFSNGGLWLPSSLSLSYSQIDYICEKIIDYKKGEE
jgi:perosamine synthetase